MTIKTRLAKLEVLALPPKKFRSVIQIAEEGKESRPTDEEVEAQLSEWRDEGIGPGLVRIQIVRAPER